METELVFSRSNGEPLWCRLLVKNLEMDEIVDLVEDPERAVDYGHNLLAQLAPTVRGGNRCIKKLQVTWHAVHIALEPPFGGGNPLKRIYETMDDITTACIAQAQRDGVT